MVTVNHISSTQNDERMWQHEQENVLTSEPVLRPKEEPECQSGLGAVLQLHEETWQPTADTSGP